MLFPLGRIARADDERTSRVLFCGVRLLLSVIRDTMFRR